MNITWSPEGLIFPGLPATAMVTRLQKLAYMHMAGYPHGDFWEDMNLRRLGAQSQSCLVQVLSWGGWQ